MAPNSKSTRYRSCGDESFLSLNVGELRIFAGALGRPNYNLTSLLFLVFRLIEFADTHASG